MVILTSLPIREENLMMEKHDLEFLKFSLENILLCLQIFYQRRDFCKLCIICDAEMVECGEDDEKENLIL